MAVTETQVGLWEALAGRAPDRPIDRSDSDVWSAVVERLNPAKARPVLRARVERADLVSVRGVSYTMLRSPDGGGQARYLRLTVEEVRLAQLMNGSRTVAQLVAEFARISGRLAPDQVRRVVADLAANRMLEELPVDAFAPLQRVRRVPWPVRWGRLLWAVARGRRMVVADVDRLVGAVYRAGGRLLFTRAAVLVMGALALGGLGLFCWRWWRGEQSVFVTHGSYTLGAAVLLGLNVLALACHEAGHALATKHAGRRVSAAGVLVYFGLPSIFVDTTDVWMAGRAARLRTTAAGPAAGLVLAGVAQVVALVVPAAGPWAFKLSFAWYVNALFNLNPMLALDGYYLLMDWLELPNLRSRGLAWVAARLRRRPPSWRQLDGEGRLVALYGMSALAWLLISVNIAYRVWTDRIAGLAVGLWDRGWLARGLLLAVVAGLAAPAAYAIVGRLAGRLRRVARRVRERDRRRDAPRRLAVLQAGALARLPHEGLDSLAGQARWVHPADGGRLAAAGAAQSAVYVVTEGSVYGRLPDDPPGHVRARVGPGGLVGLAAALAGTPAAQDWYADQATLLALPAAAVTGLLLPLPGPAPAERAEAERLFAETPALEHLCAEDRAALVSVATPADIAPEAPILLPANTSVVIASGVIVLPDGGTLQRGTMIGPVDAQLTDPVAYARTPVRAWMLPPVAELSTLAGTPMIAGLGDAATGGPAPAAGAHPPGDYPPLAEPPGPPPLIDNTVDRRLEGRLRWLMLLLLLFALLMTGGNLIPGPAWAEMPPDSVLLTATRGHTTATLRDRPVRLHEGQRTYLRAGDRVDVDLGAAARLTYRGGAVTMLCPGTALALGPLFSDTVDRSTTPRAELRLSTGRLLADTASTSGAYAPLALIVTSGGHTSANFGKAWYAAETDAATVSSGAVQFDGQPQPPTHQPLSCGDGVAVSPPAGSPTPTPTEPTPTPTPVLTPTPTPSVTPTRTARPQTSAPVVRTSSATATPSRTVAPTPTPTPTMTTTTAPANQAPTATWAQEPSGTIAQQTANGACTDNSTTASGSVNASDPEGDALTVTIHWSGFTDGSGAMVHDGSWFGTVGPVAHTDNDAGGTLKVWVTVSDGHSEFTLDDAQTVTVDQCVIIG